MALASKLVFPEVENLVGRVKFGDFVTEKGTALIHGDGMAEEIHTINSEKNKRRVIL